MDNVLSLQMLGGDALSAAPSNGCSNSNVSCASNASCASFNSGSAPCGCGGKNNLW